MKKKSVQKLKSYTWVWIVVALIGGMVFGYVAHYTIANWHGFFAVCEDGKRPDKNGCCSGEVYTDAGDGWMVCCPDGGNDCFPPIK